MSEKLLNWHHRTTKNIKKNYYHDHLSALNHSFSTIYYRATTLEWFEKTNKNGKNECRVEGIPLFALNFWLTHFL